MGFGIHVMDDDRIRGVPMDFTEVQAELSGGGTHQSAMGGDADSKEDGTFCPRLFRRFYRSGDCGGFTGNHDLAGRVEIGGADFAGGAVANADDVLHRPSPGWRHGAFTGGDRFLHDFAAHMHELDGFGEGHGACGTKGGVFAQRVACHIRRVDTAFVAQDIGTGNASGK